MKRKSKTNKTYLITRSAGFIGYYLSKKLLEKGCKVTGIDNINNYYNTKLKEARQNNLTQHKNHIFIKADISEKDTINKIFKEYKPEIVVNLAAQAGVRYSLENPDV
jgi:UDP-glucuronate 4-epimerase